MKTKCEHKWLPNGMIKKDVYSSLSTSAVPSKSGEIVYVSAVCEKCGRIKIRKVNS